MKVIADLHIHSSYSRATSSRISLPYLDRWARIKGIGLLGTGDCTHPQWLEELRTGMNDAGEGFYELKKEERDSFDSGGALIEGLPEPKTGTPRFVITGEIATIYKKDDKIRKIHHLIILPDFRAAAAFNTRLEGIGANIRSDGRPILGIDSRDLLAMLLEADERSLLIPAHIWTPWFSVLGAKSGFDSIEECYGDLTHYIPAIETGLSSNPPMNWALRNLDGFSIISNSDAHSPGKLGREATIFEMELSYPLLRRALFLPAQNEAAILGTIEFFPQEGKYHYDGHRKCNFSRAPDTAAEGNYLCPVCGKALTRGVMGRVLELADRRVNEEEPCPQIYEGSNRRPYHSLIPLQELCAELLGAGAASKKTTAAYFRLIEKGGSEFAVLMDMSREDLEKIDIPELSGEILAEAIMRMRSGEVSVSPGYDGEYGTIKVFAGAPMSGKDLFGEVKKTNEKNSSRKGTSNLRFAAQREDGNIQTKPPPQRQRASAFGSLARDNNPKIFTPDEDQEKAVSYNGKETIIIAGPGTGKTAVLTARIARLIGEGADPASILAMTFTVKAAAELKERISRLCGPGATVTAATFHSFCCSVLREQSAAAGLNKDFNILGEKERSSLLSEIGGRQARRLGLYIEERKRRLLLPGEEFPKFAGAGTILPLTPGEWKIPPVDAGLETLYGRYREALKKSQSLDFEDLTAGAVRLFAFYPEILKTYRQRFRHVFVDEYQDINFSQYALIRILVAGGDSPSLWVIGDPNQAIYGFRGSDKRFIDSFLNDYPNSRRFLLSRSFRCAEPIIHAAGKLTGTRLRGKIDGNKNAARDSGAEKPGEVILYRTQYPTEKSEAEGIARTIEALMGGTSFFAMDSMGSTDSATGDSLSGGGDLAPEDCAVLVRTAALTAPIVKALKDHGIPYQLSSESPWWMEEPAPEFLDFLRKRGETDSIQSAWGKFTENEKQERKKRKIPEVIEKLIDLSGYFGDISSLLDVLESSAVSGIHETRTVAGVKVMTIHASKGLEFEQVFVAGLEEGVLPFTLFDKTGENGGSRAEAERIEEERRLLYVAMTRAKRGLRLSWAESRTYRGRKLSGGQSRFITELEKIIPLVREDNPRKRDGQLNLF